MFKKNQTVHLCLAAFGELTKEKATVLRVNKKGVWLDNGEGNSPSGPYDATSGRYLGPSVPGARQYIEPSV